ncbi:MAG: hypothetical protein Edafosvirus52_1 [Edafosvirus sp.]|uniref:Uncharacterized protein n=1 Tax=Edafosvirus sp. TaxID=2487765 RepID=A0A3G4ZVK7_9VIRU|nr:MAG: hypothetical protein Edafosvirus52_1 [Edafosvirus sp.]
MKQILITIFLTSIIAIIYCDEPIDLKCRHQIKNELYDRLITIYCYYCLSILTGTILIIIAGVAYKFKPTKNTKINK